MQLCNQGAKPLQGFGGAVSKCREGLRGAAHPSAACPGDAAPQDAKRPGAATPRYIPGVWEAAAPR